MARRKRKSLVLDKAKTRAAALASISASLDLGGDMTMLGYNGAISDTENKLNEYNTKLSELDGVLNGLVGLEKILKDWSERMLAGVASKFGKDSSEYEEAGGTRKSERKKRTPKAKTEPK